MPRALFPRAPWAWMCRSRWPVGLVLAFSRGSENNSAGGCSCVWCISWLYASLLSAREPREIHERRRTGQGA